MAAIWHCDKCGKQAQMEANWSGVWFGPGDGWCREEWNPNRGHGDIFVPKVFCSLKCASEFYGVENPQDMVRDHISDDDYFDWVDSASEEEREREAKKVYVVGGAFGI